MSISLEVRANRLGTMSANLEGLLAQVVKKSAFDVEAGAKANITGGAKTGRIYRRRRRAHQASAPGESPANDTGNLASGIKAERISNLLWKVGVSALYGFILEFGGAFVAKRPFMAPAVEKVRRPFQDAVAAAVKKAAQ